MRKFMQTARNVEQSGTFEPGRSKALERKVENAHGTVTVWYVHEHALKTKETL